MRDYLKFLTRYHNLVNIYLYNINLSSIIKEYAKESIL